ncbi:MATE family efflux transporter [Flavobacteriaceae bacterium]|nr:MATE family efflux transporter [Flavobacteriaceae bacterium]
MLGMLGHTLVSLVDNIMVGKLDPTNLAAVSLGNSFVFIGMAIGIGFSSAITPLIAEADSENNHHKLQSTFVHGIILCTALSLLLFLSIFFFRDIMLLMNQPEAVVELALPYLELVVISLIPLLIFQAFKQFCDGLSLTIYPMYAAVIANVINVLINYVLIFGKFGFPQMGIMGAAIGTLISRTVMLVFLILIVKYNSKIKQCLNDIRQIKIDKLMFKKILDIGIPSSLQMVFEVVFFTTAIWLSGLLGENPQSANQIALNLSSMTFMIASGLSVSAMVRVGNQKGLKNYVDLRRISFSILLLGLILALFFALCFILFNDLLPYIYIDLNNTLNYKDNLEVIEITSKLLIIAAVYQISDTIQVIILAALRGMQDVKIPTLITFVAYWLIGFPVSYFLGSDDMLGSEGIWIGLLSGLTIAATLLYIRFNILTNRLITNN